MLIQDNISEDLRAAALLLDHGYHGAAGRLLGWHGIVLPAPETAPRSLSMGEYKAAHSENQDGAAGEEDPPPTPGECATPGCGAAIRSDNRSGLCVACRRKKKLAAPSEKACP